MTARKGREGGLLPLLALTLMINVLGTVTEKGYNNTDHINTKSLVPLHPLSNIEITKYFNYNPRFNDVFSRENLPTIKDGAYAINLNDKVKEHVEFHYLMTEIPLCTLILLELNVFRKKY